MNAVPVLRTERLALRGPQVRDFDRYAAFYASDRAAFVGGPIGVKEAWRRFAADAGHWALKGFGWWVVEAEGAQVGHVGLHHPPHQPDLELGWLIYDGAEGKGIAAEAARAARDWGRANLPLGRLVSYIDRDNAASVRLAERLGATLEAEAAPHDPASGVWLHPGPGATS